MADLKISQLTSASTPLAGTEVLPIVQSGSTVKVSVANLTAGRAVGMAGGSFTDNITQSTAAKGVNFTANTPAAGMTSQLLNWYEEGTWTPVLRGATVAGTYETASVSGRYTRIGRQVTIQCYMEFANVITGGGSGYAQITGLPFAKAADTTFPTGALFTKGVDWTAGTPIVAPITSGSTSVLYFPEIIDNAANNNIDISGFSAQDTLAFTLTYNAA